jgi:hypothetical protein
METMTKLPSFLLLTLVFGCTGKEIIDSSLSGECVVLMDKVYVYESKCLAISGEFILSSTTREMNRSNCLAESYIDVYSKGHIFVVDKFYRQHRGSSGFCYRAIVRDLKNNTEFDIPACAPPHPKPYWMEYLDGGIYLDDKYIKITDCPNAEGK